MMVGRRRSPEGGNKMPTALASIPRSSSTVVTSPRLPTCGEMPSGVSTARSALCGTSVLLLPGNLGLWEFGAARIATTLGTAVT